MLNIIGLMLAVIILNQLTLRRKVDCLMATLAEVNAVLDAVAAGVDALEAAIADLKTQVAAGGVVSQAKLDALSAKAADIAADIADSSDQG